jgi:hypothetical protein
LILAAILVASIPATFGTTRLLAILWNDPGYAHLRFGPDRVPAMDALLDVRSPRPTVLTYEDWSSLVWYETGAAVVAVEPPGYAKLAFDPAAFTPHGQAERRSDLAAALRGDVAVLADTAGRYGADRIVLARRGATVGLIGQPAVLAAMAGRVSGETRVQQGNGWDAQVLAPGATLTVPVTATGRIDLEIRLLTRDLDAAPPTDGSEPAPASSPHFRVRAGGAVMELQAIPTVGVDFTVVTASVDLPAGTPLLLEAVDPITIQSINGFVTDPGPPPGWTVAAQTDDAVVWQRGP